MKKHILVVDKDQFILYALAKALTDDGCEVKTAETATEAIEKLSFRPYDLCLLDVFLADLNGQGLINVINDISQETKVILLTASPFDFPEFNENNLELGVNGVSYFIPKPFDLIDVVEVVHQVLRKPGGKKFAPPDLFSRDAEEKSRKHTRKSWKEDINFDMSVIHKGVQTRLSMKAKVVDISERGVGLLTTYPLRERQVISFDNKMDSRVGVVAWSRMIGKERFRVGVRFA